MDTNTSDYVKDAKKSLKESKYDTEIIKLHLKNEDDDSEPVMKSLKEIDDWIKNSDVEYSFEDGRPYYGTSMNIDDSDELIIKLTVEEPKALNKVIEKLSDWVEGDTLTRYPSEERVPRTNVKKDFPITLDFWATNKTNNSADVKVTWESK